MLYVNSHRITPTVSVHFLESRDFTRYIRYMALSLFYEVGRSSWSTDQGNNSLPDSLQFINQSSTCCRPFEECHVPHSSYEYNACKLAGLATLLGPCLPIYDRHSRVTNDASAKRLSGSGLLTREQKGLHTAQVFSTLTIELA